MSILDQVMTLKEKGVSDSEIINNLKEKGVSPKEITEALSQAKIKEAVSSQEGIEDGMERSVLGPERGEELPTEGSISDEDLTPPPSVIPPSMQARSYAPLHQEEGEELYVPQPGDYSPYAQPQYPVYQSYQQQQIPQNFAPPEPDYIPQESSYEYSAQEGATQTGMTDTDTVIEISEQVFADKVRGILKQLEVLNEFRVLSETKIGSFSERLKRIESSIDMLQIAILEKVGSYGRNLETVKKEMEMMQDSFGKIVGVAAEGMRHKHHQQHQSNTQYTQNVSHHTPTHAVQRIEKKTTVVHKSHSNPTKRHHSKK